jgi:pimeloyl-ACP methyl ester carboxylesterase
MDDFAAHGYEVHSFSMPGHGKSGKSKSLHLYTATDFVNALSQVIDSITPTPFVIAHSLGGYVLQRYLKKHTLPAAVLLGTLPHYGVIPFYLRYFMRHPLRYLTSVLSLNIDRMMRSPKLIREYLITDGAAISPDVLLEKLENESLFAALEAMLPVGKIQAGTPILVVAGQNDGIFPQQEEERVAEHYNADMIVQSGQNHNLMVEHGWQQTASDIRSWLEMQKGQ